MTKADGTRNPFPTFDELDFLRQMYTPEQILEMWEACMPKLDENFKIELILGTKDNENETNEI